MNKSTPALPECASTLISTYSSIDTLTALPTSITTFPSTIQKQPSIKLFLSTKVSSNNKPAKLPVETYFKVPAFKNSFNIRFLRRHFNSVILKQNIVSIMQKSAQNNYINPWNPSIKNHLHNHCSHRIQNHEEINKTKTISNKKKHSSSLAIVFSQSGSINRCFLEDFI